ncbi:MAG TPA: SurA N-terminal domain-containing protein, partial [Myxococcota bacterium]|nr:SurA N-terminal domain-containing protein [Myxococcota bacterium]
MLRSHALSLLAAAALLACNGNTPQSVSGENGGTPVAKIGSETITQAELDAWIKDELWRSQTEDGNAAKVFSLRQRGLSRMIDQRLIDAEAERRHLDPDALLDQEAAKRVAVTDEEVKAFYEQHAAEWGDRKLETEAAGIRDYLARTKGTEAAQAFVA